MADGKTGDVLEDQNAKAFGGRVIRTFCGRHSRQAAGKKISAFFGDSEVGFEALNLGGLSDADEGAIRGPGAGVGDGFVCKGGGVTKGGFDIRFPVLRKREFHVGDVLGEEHGKASVGKVLARHDPRCGTLALLGG